MNNSIGTKESFAVTVLGALALGMTTALILLAPQGAIPVHHGIADAVRALSL